MMEKVKEHTIEQNMSLIYNKNSKLKTKTKNLKIPNGIKN